MPKAVSLACLLGALAAGSAVAQQPGRATYPPPPTSLQPQRAAGKVMYFHKPAAGVVPASASSADPIPQPSLPPLSATSGLPEIPLPSGAIPQPPPLPRPAIAYGAQDDKKDKPLKLPEPDAKQIAEFTKLETRDRIFSMPNDATLEKYVRMKTLEYSPEIKEKDLLPFPTIPDVGEGKPYVAKTGSYPPMRAEYYSTYVVHRRLHFEDRNTERYGWDLGIVQPAVSAFLFYKDVFLWPQSLASGCAYGFWDTSAGKCLPGSPTPYMLYPPGLTITGSVFEGVIVTGMSFVIP